jgi:hypothetical protein
MRPRGRLNRTQTGQMSPSRSPLNLPPPQNPAPPPKLRYSKVKPPSAQELLDEDEPLIVPPKKSPGLSHLPTNWQRIDVTTPLAKGKSGQPDPEPKLTPIPETDDNLSDESMDMASESSSNGTAPYRPSPPPPPSRTPSPLPDDGGLPWDDDDLNRPPDNPPSRSNTEQQALPRRTYEFSNGHHYWYDGAGTRQQCVWSQDAMGEQRPGIMYTTDDDVPLVIMVDENGVGTARYQGSGREYHDDDEGRAIMDWGGDEYDGAGYDGSSDAGEGDEDIDWEHVI